MAEPVGDPPLQQSEVSESSGRQSSSDENGHVESPDETLSPTSVIYFKEALNSSNLRFGKAGSLSPTPLRQFDFRIERIESKRKSKCFKKSRYLPNQLTKSSNCTCNTTKLC